MSPFLICEMRVILLPSSQDLCENSDSSPRSEPRIVPGQVHLARKQERQDSNLGRSDVKTHMCLALKSRRRGINRSRRWASKRGKSQRKQGNGEELHSGFSPSQLVQTQTSRSRAGIGQGELVAVRGAASQLFSHVGLRASIQASIGSVAQMILG